MTKKLELPVDDILSDMLHRLDPKEFKQFMNIIDDFIINGIDTNDPSQHDAFIKDVIYYHDNKILHQLIGDHIITVYKKNDLTQQSFHTTDTSRLNYVVRIIENSSELIDNSDSEKEVIQYDSDSEDDRYNFINEATMTEDERELYSERLAAIEWFEKNHPDEFDLFGHGWDHEERPSYRYPVPLKRDVYNRYKFHILNRS